MNRIYKILTGLAAFAVVMGICEAYIRLANISEVSTTMFSDNTGKTRRKNFEYFFINEGMACGKLNEYGFIGGAYPLKKPENTIRIALLGDSFIEAYQVFERHYFGTVAKKELESAFPGIKFEIMNFGCAGFEITDMYAYQKNTVERFDPDYIFYLISRDDLEPENSDLLRPVVSIQSDSLRISYDFNPAEIKKFKRADFFLMHSAVFSMMNDSRKKLEIVSPASIIFDKVYLWFSKPEIDKHDKMNGETEYKINPVTSKIIKSSGPSKVVIINRGDVEMPESFIALCKENKVPFFDLYPVLAKAKESGHDPRYWAVTRKHGHWNYEGHQLAGRELSKIAEGLIRNN